MVKKLLTTLTSVTVLLALTGCSVTKEVIPLPTSSSTCTVEATEFKNVAIGSTAIEDGYGCYTKTLIDTNSTLLVQDDNKIDFASLEANGFTVESALAAQQLTARFFVEETLDSVALDNSKEETRWLDALPEYFSEATLNSVKEEIDKGALSSTGLILVGFLPEPLRRDNMVRATDTQVDLVSVSAGLTDSGEAVLKVSYSAELVYEVNDSVFVNWVLKNRSDLTKENLQVTNPELFDNTGFNKITVTVNSTFSVKDDKISGAVLDVKTI